MEVDIFFFTTPILQASAAEVVLEVIRMIKCNVREVGNMDTCFFEVVPKTLKVTHIPHSVAASAGFQR